MTRWLITGAHGQLGSDLRRVLADEDVCALGRSDLDVADLRAVADQIGDGKLSFASPERLMTHLGLAPGSVSPFGLVNDRAHAVRVVIDRDLQAAARLSFHPNINTATLVVSTTDFTRFLAACGNTVKYVVV